MPNRSNATTKPFCCLPIDHQAGAPSRCEHIFAAELLGCQDGPLFPNLSQTSSRLLSTPLSTACRLACSILGHVEDPKYIFRMFFFAHQALHFPMPILALANPLPLVLPVPRVAPPLPLAIPDVCLCFGAGVINLLDDLVEVGGFSTKEVSVVLIDVR